MPTRRRRTRPEESILSIFIQMFALVAAIVLVASFLWKDLGKEKPDTPKLPDSTGGSSQTTGDTTPIETTVPPDTSPEGIFEAFLKANNLTKEAYTDRQLEAYEKSPEARDFVLSIPLEKNKPHTPDISSFSRDTVPLFMQWDARWGYHEYAFDVGGVTGCGPTCLSMVAYYLTGNTEYTPAYMMDFSTAQGCVGETGGTNWTLFSKAAPELGFKVEEVILYDGAVIKHLNAGHPVIINVKEGDFTTTGHYIVIVSYADGVFKVNDPNSVANSEKTWTWAQLEPQIKNLWAFSLPEE